MPIYDVWQNFSAGGFDGGGARRGHHGEGGTREALDAVPPLLEKLRQSILAAAFRGELTADWRAQNPNTESASGSRASTTSA